MTAPPPFSTLRRFLPKKKVERCHLCGLQLSPDHPHLVDLESRNIVCACEPCSILFLHRAEGKYRRIGRDVRFLADFQMTDGEWDSLYIPIGLAFFVESSAAGRIMAYYPGPAGSTESLLSLRAWDEIRERNPALLQMVPDTEALLVNRVKGARDHYVLPIDHCYRLVGLIRTHWRGLSGGDDVWREIGGFFGDLQRRSMP